MSSFQFKIKERLPQNMLKDTQKLLADKTNTAHNSVRSSNVLENELIFFPIQSTNVTFRQRRPNKNSSSNQQLHQSMTMSLTLTCRFFLVFQ